MEVRYREFVEANQAEVPQNDNQKNSDVAIGVVARKIYDAYVSVAKLGENPALLPALKGHVIKIDKPFINLEEKTKILAKILTKLVEKVIEDERVAKPHIKEIFDKWAAAMANETDKAKLSRKFIQSLALPMIPELATQIEAIQPGNLTVIANTYKEDKAKKAAAKAQEAAVELVA